METKKGPSEKKAFVFFVVFKNCCPLFLLFLTKRKFAFRRWFCSDTPTHTCLFFLKRLLIPFSQLLSFSPHPPSPPTHSRNSIHHCILALFVLRKKSVIEPNQFPEPQNKINECLRVCGTQCQRHYQIQTHQRPLTDQWDPYSEIFGNCSVVAVLCDVKAVAFQLMTNYNSCTNSFQLKMKTVHVGARREPQRLERVERQSQVQPIECQNVSRQHRWQSGHRQNRRI